VIELTSASTGISNPGIPTYLSDRRIRFFDNQAQGLGLELTGNLWFGNGNSRTQTRTNAGLQGDVGAQSGFYEFNQPVSSNSATYNYPAGYITGAGGGTWWHMIDTRHSNPGNNFAMQIAGNFFDQRLFYRKTNNNASEPWNEILSVPQGQSPVQIHSIILPTNHTPNANTPTYDINTGVSVADCDCFISEHSSAYDITESGRRQRKMWSYHNTGTGNWHVSINVGAHSDGNPNWTNTDIKLVCFRKNFVQWFGQPRDRNQGY
jgi:hypothetical protein